MNPEAIFPRRTIWIWLGKKWHAGVVVSTFKLRGTRNVWLGLFPRGNAYAVPEVLMPRNPALKGIDKPRPPVTEDELQLSLDLEVAA